jgi:hypothetical protein
LFAKGDRVYIYDHETAFSFLLEVFPSPEPWLLSHQQYLKDHVFYRRLKSQPIDLARFSQVLGNLSETTLLSVVADVPAEWDNGVVAQDQGASLCRARPRRGVRRGDREVPSMKFPYHFSVLRYVHDPVTEEFVNIGVVLFSPAARYMRAVCTSSYSRITRVFERIDGDRFRQLARYVQQQVCEEGRKHETALPFAPEQRLEALLARILPPDDSALQFSTAGVGLTEDLDRTLQELYQRHVERYTAPGESSRRSDEEVWRVFKEPLDRALVTSSLKPRRIIAPDFEYEFKRSWKNERWHVCEPVSFDLVDPDSILDRANRWLGRVTNLRDSSEPFEIHFLLGEPRERESKAAFVKAENILHKIPGPNQFVKESEAEEFAGELARDMKAHPIVGGPE